MAVTHIEPAREKPEARQPDFVVRAKMGQSAKGWATGGFAWKAHERRRLFDQAERAADRHELERCFEALAALMGKRTILRGTTQPTKPRPRLLPFSMPQSLTRTNRELW